MRAYFIIFLAISAIMETYAQNTGGDRKPVAAGRFYASDKTELSRSIGELYNSCKKVSCSEPVRALIVPHAGYVYSGKTAAAGISCIPSGTVYKNIFIIGSSHVMAFDGASVYSSGNYITPLGPANVNRVIAGELIKSGTVFRFPETSHAKEHSIEVQIPLLQYYFREMPPIVPIIIGTGDTNTLKKIASALRPYFKPENLFVISSDFSHYPAYREATATDKATAGAIISGDAQTFLRTLETNDVKHVPGLATSMCGWTSGLTLLYLTGGDATYEYRLIDYCNSGDSPYGNKDEVVGYNAIALFATEKGADEGKIKGELSFSENEAGIMFAIARSAIGSKLNPGKEKPVNKAAIPAHLKEPYGAFVTLKIGGQLRGCIGRFISAEPLCDVIKASAISSAFEDPRFLPLTAEEYRKTSIEITVLGPMKKIENVNEIILGRHGIYVKNGNRAGTMLPQVATENGWSLEQFLGYTSRDKAGLGWEGWKTSEIYIYEGKVLGEQKH